MKLFGKDKESLLIGRIRSCRAMYTQVDGEAIQMVEIHLKTKDGERLDLQIPPHLVPDLIGGLTNSYEAINPPLSRRTNRAATWADND